MKLTQQAETELLHDYYKLWTANLSADVETFASYMVDDFSVFGSANGEIFFSKDEAIEFYAATADQLKNKAQLRDRNVSIQALDEKNVVIRETSNLYVLIGDVWTFYGFARISCVLKQIDKRWKVVHQHASFPDHRTEPGQQLAAEKIEKENFALKEAVQRRTVELEAKSRELEIEAAVERVRAQSMAMQQTSDIAKVTEALYQQLTNLKIKDFTGVAIYLVDEEEMVTVWDLSSPGSMGDASNYAFKYNPKVTPTLSEFIPIWRAAQQEYFVMDYPKEKLLIGMDELEPFYPAMAESFRNAISSGLLEHQWNATAIITQGVLSLDMMAPPTEEVRTITLKMAAAFNLAYQRFHDLQKAEKQTKEAQIELSLERVRARSLAMHTTGELQEVIDVVHKELLNLNIAISGGSFIAINNQINNELRCWGSGGTADTSEEVHIPLYEKPFCTNLINGIKRGAGFFTEEYSQEEKKAFFTFLFKHEPWSKLDADQKKETLFSPGGYTRSCAVSEHTSIFIINHFGERFSIADNDTLQRFGKVFEQAYTRFLDLQKAEAQARESQIQLALERVRARTMAMQRSDELLETATQLFRQIEVLGAPAWNCSFNIWQDDKKRASAWNGTKNGFGRPFTTNSSEDVFSRFFEADQKGEELYVEEIGGPALKQHYDYLATVPGVSQTMKELKEAGIELPLYQVFNIAYFSQGYLMFITFEPVPQLWDVFKRFAKVFEQAYTRFLDLQKAEAQARESQIQLALERVRARTMAMQKSEELADAAAVLFEQVKNLGIETYTSGFNIWDEQQDNLVSWMANPLGIINPPFIMPAQEYRQHQMLYEAWKNGTDFLEEDLTGNKIREHYKYLRSFPLLETAFAKAEEAGIKTPERQVHNAVFFSHGYILFVTLQPQPEHRDQFKRFGQVFQQTYTRFLDLQKAEAQTREAQIELSLERIRAKVSAMKVSSDLLDIVVTMRTEFVALGHEAHYFWHMRWLPERYDKAMTSGDGSRIGHVMTLPRHIHGDVPLIAHWERTNEPTVVYAMDAEAAVDYVTKMINLGNFEQVDPNSPTLDDIRHIGGLTFIMARTTHGEIGYSLPGVVTHPPAEAVATVVRFASVFDLAYRRFEDLKSSEKQIREAQIELALERVRARSLAMHKSEELGELSLELVKQVQGLGVSTWFCAFNIYDENEPRSLEWGSNGIGTFPTYITPRENVFLKYHDAGQKGETLLINAIGELECPAHYDYLYSLPGIGDQLLAMKAAGIPFPSFQIDHVSFMKYGYLLFITYEPVPEAHDIFIRFATVFEQTYTRFLDLQKAEALAIRAKEDLIAIKEARQNAEAALTELQATQKQLVQSEKMASLGELTAGIAHEIQNPLNFVNNFSEVNVELIDELEQELDKGNTAEAKAIAIDIKENEQKINHHGKRADAIVKGMLQHSRSSSATKEPTDINQLADEYLRLAYHGLRAKDKSFNATLKTDFDESIGNINIIPQDIGRVILNLITNAFYAVTEKKKQKGGGYKPTVSVSTKRINETVEIKVADNGNGIPKNILDKVFQPFFTTKPTGHGTGLGLSLSYDIVKAHGGELKVQTRDNEGTGFIILIPIL